MVPHYISDAPSDKCADTRPDKRADKGSDAIRARTVGAEVRSRNVHELGLRVMV